MKTVKPPQAWMVLCRDLPGPIPARLRQELATVHFAHIEAIFENILIAGPLRNEDGETTGSLLILAADSEAAVRALIAGDPYARADIWASVEVTPFLAAAGTWLGGKIW